MIGIRVKSKKELKERYLGKSIDHLIIETSFFGTEYSENVKNLCYVGPCPYTNRKFYGQITVVDGILKKAS